MIYTREANPMRMTLPLKITEIHSAKKSVDAEIIDKFPLVTYEGEKSMLQDVPLKYSYRTFSAKRDDQILQNIISAMTVDNPEIGTFSVNLQNFRSAANSRAFPSKKAGSKTNQNRNTGRKPTLQQFQSSKIAVTKSNSLSTPRSSGSQSAVKMAPDEDASYENAPSRVSGSVLQNQMNPRSNDRSVDLFSELEGAGANRRYVQTSNLAGSQQEVQSQNNIPSQNNVQADDIFDPSNSAVNTSNY